jgi:hypothetical protein
MGVQCVHFGQRQAPCSSLCGVWFKAVVSSVEKRELTKLRYRLQKSMTDTLVVPALAVLLWFALVFLGSAVCCFGSRPRNLQPLQARQ